MADPAVMGATTPDGISFLVSGSPINPVSESAQQASSIQAAFSNRAIYSYVWSNAAGRAGQTGMRQGDTGYQTDTDQPYWYLDTSFGWCPVLIGHPSYGGGRMITSSTLITPTGTSGNYTGSKDITFPVGYFNSTPQIQVTPWSVNPNFVNASYSNPTAAGFTVYVGRTDGSPSPTTVTWTASQ